jgi:hypothetical protein
MSIRSRLSRADRVRVLEPSIDPGFVNRRLVETILGEPGMSVIDEMTRRLPPQSDWQHEIRLDHIYKDVLLKFCEIHGILPLEQLLAKGKGTLFSSVETLAACPEVYNAERVVSHWVPRGDVAWKVEFHYSTKWIAADTLRMRLHKGSDIALVAHVDNAMEDRLICHPLVMGGAWLRTQDPVWEAHAMWWGNSFFENFIEDIDEFSAVLHTPEPQSHEPMSRIKEVAFKTCLAEILGELVPTDWGGELSDLYTSHIRLGGRRVSAAFLLKGRADYRPMSLNHLGKNNDQIVRLADEPADLLVVQHSHDILPAVRKTLRAFAVQPSKARRYCLIDGKDSLRLLNAYGLYEKAVKLSSHPSSCA